MASKSGARLRARAAKKAYKSVISDVSGKDTGSEYSPRAFVKDQFGKHTAQRIGKGIAKSAAKPGKSTAYLGKPRQRKAVVTPRNSAIDYTKLGNKLSIHASLGEVKGVTRDIEQAYRKNLRVAKRKRKKGK